MREDEGSDKVGEDPPSLHTFMERSLGRLLVEGLVGTAAGALLSVALGAGDLRAGFMLLGAVSAPVALMLTPVRGPVAYRAVRYGLALFVLLTLVVSMTGPGRDRPIGELILYGFLFFAVGSLGHGLMAATVDRDTEGDGT